MGELEDIAKTAANLAITLGKSTDEPFKVGNSSSSDKSSSSTNKESDDDNPLRDPSPSDKWSDKY